jgi:hypothetical protein
VTHDLTTDKPINYAACAYRDYRAGILTRDGASLILMNSLKLPAESAATALDAEPGSDALARALCDRDGWDRCDHDRTDDYPCTGCKEDAAVLAFATASAG